ncbi:MAG: PASTA domain-containing protein, partial [Actinomycetota bacterium]|nr:PASTA domain-containing protein [Actinomycetota bacterium]
VPIPARPPGSLSDPTTRALPGRHGAATEVLRGADLPGRNDTFVGGTRHLRVPAAGMAPRERDTPPPPVVTPPTRGRRRPSARTRRRRRVFLAVVVVLLLGLLAGYGGWWFAAGRYGTVPNVTNDSQSIADSQLRHAGYRVSSQVTDQFSETIPAGLVVSTDPGIGSREPRGHTITVIVSKGKERFGMPQVANLTLAQAQSTLATIPIQIAPSPTSQASDTVPAGKVIGTNPPGGAQVKRDAIISIIVSTGLPILAIPVVAPATPVDRAERSLHAAGFKTTESAQYSTDIAQGEVISTSPTGTAQKGSVITVVVSKGPQIVAVPAIAGGTPVSDAEAALTQVGLKYKVAAFAGGASTVLAISPGAGTPVQAGSTVTIYAI